ncbi:ABC protein [Favolaschia claudopus]|uniref:ABC protein n=1 Tax=Favolaschia claudopus TaxID=2862362 RepID=A0AAW0BW21_9AGAR
MLQCLSKKLIDLDSDWYSNFVDSLLEMQVVLCGLVENFCVTRSNDKNTASRCNSRILSCRCWRPGGHYEYLLAIFLVYLSFQPVHANFDFAVGSPTSTIHLPRGLIDRQDLVMSRSEMPNSQNNPHCKEDWASLSQFKGLPGTRRYNLLHSNEAPFDAELTDFRNVIKQTGVPLARLEDEIARTRRHLQDLEGRRAELWSFREQNRKVLSPLRRVPPEVLGEIFQWTLFSSHNSGSKISNSPWKLTHVCRRWRDVAISRASLWSLVAINFVYRNSEYRDDSDSSRMYPLPMVETQIERAQSHNLMIHFYGNEVAKSEPQIQVLECLMQYMSRWEELSIGLTSFLYPILERMAGQLPLLRRLWVEWMCLESQQLAGPIMAFQGAHSLVDAAIGNSYMYTPVFLPIGQLTRYQLDASWHTHRDILRLAPNLVEAHIAVNYDEDGDWPEPPASDDNSLQLTLLKRLYVSHPEILQYITFPTLEEIALELTVDDVLSVPHLSTSVDRSSCTIRSLCVVGCPIPSSTLVQFPSVTEFRILLNNPEVPSEAFDLLLADLTASPHVELAIVAPQLRDISIGHDLEEREFVFSPYLAMLESRRNIPNPTLCASALVSDSKIQREPGTESRIRALREKCLRLEFVSGRCGTDELSRWSFGSTWS